MIYLILKIGVKGHLKKYFVKDLPGFPEVAPDPSARAVEPPKPIDNPWKKETKPQKVNSKCRLKK